jgi:hypothetical protein
VRTKLTDLSPVCSLLRWRATKVQPLLESIFNFCFLQEVFIICSCTNHARSSWERAGQSYTAGTPVGVSVCGPCLQCACLADRRATLCLLAHSITCSLTWAPGAPAAWTSGAASAGCAARACAAHSAPSRATAARQGRATRARRGGSSAGSWRCPRAG